MAERCDEDGGEAADTGAVASAVNVALAEEYETEGRARGQAVMIHGKTLTSPTWPG
ncbi:hypothetical protein STSP_14800 [Streptomyces jeddahensis]|uniref:Uncharacterized protein n=1 Tax=Streptomyces jeddahensis TaxID=1716141 RepID=A0A177HVY5_9ACTN|nr:hypothetical protein STSP_14800 [Streptomyces jeddahensis]